MQNCHMPAIGTVLLLVAEAACAAGRSVANAAQVGESWMSSDGGIWASLLFAVVVFGLLMRDLSQIASESLQETEPEQ
jgi:hypothetical protein